MTTSTQSMNALASITPSSMEFHAHEEGSLISATYRLGEVCLYYTQMSDADTCPVSLGQVLHLLNQIPDASLEGLKLAQKAYGENYKADIRWSGNDRCRSILDNLEFINQTLKNLETMAELHRYGCQLEDLIIDLIRNDYLYFSNNQEAAYSV